MFTVVDSALFLSGIVTGYAHASFVESWSHDRIWHARKQTLARCHRLPIVGASVKNAWKSHSVVHHGMSFRRDHVTQFQSTAEEGGAHAYFQDNHLALANDYGLTVNLGGFLRFMIPFMLLNTVVAVTAPLLVSLPFALMSLMPALFSTFVHPYMHLPFDEAQATAPWPIALLLRSPLGPRMWIHHFLHHRHPRVCFNLGIPIGDWLRGVSSSPTAADIWELQRVGGPQKCPPIPTASKHNSF